jgi:small subunit ribosomal protein S17
MADEDNVPGTDVGDEPEEALDAASELEGTGAGGEAPEELEPAASAKSGGEVKPTAEVKAPAPAKSAAGAKSAAPAKAAPAKSAPAKSGAAKSVAPAKPAAKAPKEPTAARPRVRAAAESGADEPRTGRRKVREGIVISNAMEKTAVVAIIERVRHPRYAKTVQRTKRLYAHDEANDTRVGDRVRLSETRPLSKLKRWRVEQVLERAR